MKFNKKSILLLALASFLTSCNINGIDGIDGIDGKDGKDGKDGTNSQTLTGDIVGFVGLYEVDGNKSLIQAGVSITVEGTTKSAITDVNGRFVLSGITTGIYNLVFSKAGYGTYKIISFQFVGGGTAYSGGTAYMGYPVLTKIANFNISGLTATSSVGVINLNGTISGTVPTPYASFVTFISSNALVSSQPSNYESFKILYINTSSSSVTTSFGSTDLVKGQTIYLRTYAIPGIYMYYPDIVTGRYYFPSLGPNPSNVVSVIVK